MSALKRHQPKNDTIRKDAYGKGNLAMSGQVILTGYLGTVRCLLVDIVHGVWHEEDSGRAQDSRILGI